MILDSGNRTKFESGAVRDVQKGKGRCDLLPLEQVGKVLDNLYIQNIDLFRKTRQTGILRDIIYNFSNKAFGNLPNAMLELAMHFEDGAEKYGERNWEKGIPEERFVDSAIRHYLKWLRGDTDERHDRAFLWNIICLWWTVDKEDNKNDKSTR